MGRHAKEETTAASDMEAPAAMSMEAGGAAGGMADGKAEGEDGGCKGCTWLIWIVTAPVLIWIWLMGALCWLILIPLKCCCPCLGVPLGWLIKWKLCLMRLPFKIVRRIAGSPFENKEEDKRKEEEEIKALRK